MSTTEPGCLYIVATPIGNLEDITRRAVAVLGEVNAIAAEDTRHSRSLLQHLGINTPLFALHEHNETAAAEKVVSRLRSGETVALVSDAGTPLISDPGFILVREARRAGIPVIPVPGASSILAALSCSGLPTDRFIFEGFLPAKAGARLKRLNELAGEQRTQVYFEACLSDMHEAFGAARQAVVARELTKTWETFLTGTLAELLEQVRADANQSRGEIVVVVAGHEKLAEMDAEALHLLDVLLEELPLKQASALAAKFTGLNKKQLYQAGLDRKKETD
jgi:16S rRNA (cytidine1402-2'-O)-methyltransferase